MGGGGGGGGKNLSINGWVRHNGAEDLKLDLVPQKILNTFSFTFPCV